MNAADYLVIIVLSISLVLGTIRGFMREAIALLAWLGGIWLAWRYAEFLGPYLGGLLAGEPQRTWIGRGAILAGVLLVGWIIGGVVSYFVQQSGLSLTIDRLLGGVFGTFRGVVLVALTVMVATVVQLNEVTWWKQSKLLPYAETVSGWISGFAASAREDSSASGK
jgi:membrane protein required for colicin V production